MFFNTVFAIAATVLSATSSVRAHGYVQTVTLGSTVWPGWNPNVDPYLSPTPQRIVRKIPGNGPVEDLTLKDLQCNGWTAGGSSYDTAPAAIYGTVAAGATVALNWTTWPTSHEGPMITYLAKAPSDITQWSPGTSAVWFKIAESGKDANGKWAASDNLLANNGIYKFTIPPKLAPGQYLIRHEILALHAAWTYPGVQFYPVCIQVQVTGSGTAVPTSGLVAFPGAYTPTTPGIVYDIYTNTSAYPIPGPAVWTGGN